MKKMLQECTNVSMIKTRFIRQQQYISTKYQVTIKNGEKTLLTKYCHNFLHVRKFRVTESFILQSAGI